MSIRWLNASSKSTWREENDSSGEICPIQISKSTLKERRSCSSVLQTRSQDKGWVRLSTLNDVVVRINHAWPLPENLKNDIGTRTHILYYNLNPKKQRIRRKDVIRMRQSGIKWVVSTHPAVRARYRLRQRRFRKMSRRLVRFRAVPQSIKRRLRPHIGSVNGGLITIVDLLRYPITQLYVTGFSFYKTGYLKYPKYKSRFIKSAAATTTNAGTRPTWPGCSSASPPCGRPVYAARPKSR